MLDMEIEQKLACRGSCWNVGWLVEAVDELFMSWLTWSCLGVVYFSKLHCMETKQ